MHKVSERKESRHDLLFRINNKIIPSHLGFRTATYKLPVTSKLTDMYDLVPTKEFAMESISCPLTPKSHSLISPREFTRMFDGFTSVKKINMPQFACNKFIKAFAKLLQAYTGFAYFRAR